MKQNRRKFISTVVAGSVIVPLFSDIKVLQPVTGSLNYPLRLFSKPLDNYDFDFLCECASADSLNYQ